MDSSIRAVVAASLVVLGLAAASDASAEPPARVTCPEAEPSGTSCYAGQDANGAHYFIAIPDGWNRVLVVHARGGPYPQHLGAKRSGEDATRWVIWTKQGYAYAASQYRRGGYGARMAAEDSEHVRQLFAASFGRPRLTILHGQSWGGLVGARIIELYGQRADGTLRYDAALLSSGLLAGAPRTYEFRLDLRVVYQYYCGNHPRPTEPQYPLWMGLPAGSTMTPADLKARVDECTGVDLPAERRSDAQRRNLASIARVVRIPESSLQGHMNWATFMFADIVHNRLADRNPFGNMGVKYVGSEDDDALNARVARYRADPEAAAALAEDSEPTGRTAVPTLTVHAIGDPTAFVENEAAYRGIRTRSGTEDRLVQTFTDEHVHSFLAAPEYAALMDALVDWVDRGGKPEVDDIAARCERYLARYGEHCRFQSTYRPPALDARSYPR